MLKGTVVSSPCESSTEGVLVEDGVDVLVVELFRH